MKNIFQAIKDFLSKGKYTTNKDAAEIIRRFINNESRHPYEWDDFESQNEENSEVALALELCWFFANKFPANKPTEYCGDKANPYFLEIAGALEKNCFNGLNFEDIKKSLREGVLPKDISQMLKKV